MAENNDSVCVTAGERGDGEVAQSEKQRDGLMKSWKRQEIDLYSPLILCSVWLLEGKHMCLCAHGSLYSRTVIHRLTDEYGTSPVRHINRLISHGDTDVQSIRHFSAILKDRRRDEGGWLSKGNWKGERNRMRHETEWWRENERDWQTSTREEEQDVCHGFVLWCPCPPLVCRDAGNNVIICMEESLRDTRVMPCEQRDSVQM